MGQREKIMALTEEQRAAAIAQAEALAAAGITDDEASEALNGYLEGAMFTATDNDGNPLDSTGPDWSPTAQDAARAVVFPFIADNADACRQFIRNSGHGWTQVGIDISFTRNRHGAGFWDRGAGAVGDVLTEAAHQLGEVNVIINESGEVDFE